MKILAGDIGGTKTSLAIFEVNGTKLTSIKEEKYLSAEYSSLYKIVEEFVHSHDDTPEYACFGIAGPVYNKKIAKTTNLPWIVEASVIAEKIGFKKVWLLNDLEANAWGISTLQEDDFFTLNVGKENSSANAAIISAGTGLGEAGLYFDGKHLNPFSSEGGHSDFAPNSDLEIELLRFLKKRYGDSSHVSWERVVSGMGIVNIYDFLLFFKNETTPSWLQNEMNTGDKAAAISNAADNARCQICVQTLKLFVHFYGAEAGNLALKMMSTSTLYLGGGIAPKNLKYFRDSTFMDSFTSKGRMSQILKDIPVKIILNQKTALYGSAVFCGYKAKKA